LKQSEIMDGLIVDEERNRANNFQLSNPAAPTGTPISTLPSYDQAVHVQGPQNGYLVSPVSSHQSYSPSFSGNNQQYPAGYPNHQYQQAYPPQPPYGQPYRYTQQPYAINQSQYGAPQQQYGVPQQQYGNPQQQYGIPQQQYEGLQQQYGAPQQQYRVPQQQYGVNQQYAFPQQPQHPQYAQTLDPNAQHRPSLSTTQSSSSDITKTLSNATGMSTPSQQPPEHLGQEYTHVKFIPVPLHGDDQNHAIKALQKTSERDITGMSNIIGTYLANKRAHEDTRISSMIGRIRTTPDVIRYNHLMDKLELMSGTVLSKHRHPTNQQAWTDALNPHRRAMFAELYNVNPNVRGFCNGLKGWAMAQYPLLDEWALGKTKYQLLSFQKHTRRAPNMNVARELLSQVRTVILLDDSGSMAAPGHSSWGGQWGQGGYNSYTNSGNQSRWEQARDLLSGIAPLVSQYNRHGIDIHFLNHYTPHLGLHTPEDVQRIFAQLRPGGGTPTGQRINEILDGYMCALRYNRTIMPLNLVVITDGEAQDEELLHWAIEEHVTKIVHRGFQPHQFGVEFLQVGDDDEATRHLEKLEEEVSRHHHSFNRDVVGVTPTSRQMSMSPDQLLGIILSGIDARMNGYLRHRGTNI
jgi:hypothetical protein